MLGYSELIIIFLIVLLLFGGRKIPEIARGLGQGIREFRSVRRDSVADATSASGTGKASGAADATEEQADPAAKST